MLLNMCKVWTSSLVFFFFTSNSISCHSGELDWTVHKCVWVCVCNQYPSACIPVLKVHLNISFILFDGWSVAPGKPYLMFNPADSISPFPHQYTPLYRLGNFDFAFHPQGPFCFLWFFFFIIIFLVCLIVWEQMLDLHHCYEFCTDPFG